ncbi:MAG: response regulator [Bacteroidetes bacterium]|nr:MAG: response regulator [Bacteroidota bacterium]
MTVLVTDDMYTSRIQIGIVLKSMGYTYDEASNGEIAIEKLEKNHYDFILMDLEMPVKNGMDTTMHIRKKMQDPKKRNTPVIAITAHDPADYAVNLDQYGFNALISKPVTPQKLQEALKSIEL